ncbi:hypothetical protein M3175_01445 [Robertmurraya korlensis]|uniref:hypothetical protein n=1 Tax=Robertmurraya korlensis TaxID=519977 RepID=UPI0020416573|nr:hypothetical protein [Robertmurraya korlensis]MCM3599379.1 hypothetical protein [Robertmurraya korlensis]
MLFSDHLTREEIQRVNNLRKAIRNQKEHKSKSLPKEQRVKVKKKENLSRRDIEDLMGIRKDTYKRERGAVKRR